VNGSKDRSLLEEKERIGASRRESAPKKNIAIRVGMKISVRIKHEAEEKDKG
jgi:hypothetical protein